MLTSGFLVDLAHSAGEGVRNGNTRRKRGKVEDRKKDGKIAFLVIEMGDCLLAVKISMLHLRAISNFLLRASDSAISS